MQSMIRFFVLSAILAAQECCGGVGLQGLADSEKKPAVVDANALAPRPERKVTGNAITSASDPKLRIELPTSVHYVGADRWTLYGMADCELHAFVEADAKKNVQRIYWVQFEAYLPGRPELHHTYDSPQHRSIGGMDFYVDTWATARKAKDEAGSDSEHIKALIKADGYTLPESMMSVRFVHLLDEQKRKELMIIYSEDAAATGFTATELRPGGKAHEQWPHLAQGLIDRAANKISLHKTK